ncbi:hypothetical protein ABTB40_20615, partial [Acinetobacter baumannii]
LEAAEAGALVIGFGGVVRREIVASRAPHFIDQADLREVVRLLATPEELALVESLLRCAASVSASRRCAGRRR